MPVSRVLLLLTHNLFIIFVSAANHLQSINNKTGPWWVIYFFSLSSRYIKCVISDSSLTLLRRCTLIISCMLLCTVLILWQIRKEVCIKRKALCTQQNQGRVALCPGQFTHCICSVLLLLLLFFVFYQYNLYCSPNCRDSREDFNVVQKIKVMSKLEKRDMSTHNWHYNQCF